MIALDTNILVRFLVEDDPAQTERARRTLQRAVESDTPCYISDVVLCEIVWVLETSYEFKKAEIGEALGKLLQATHLAFSARDQLYRALEAYSVGRGDFSDYMIREHARFAGCEAVITFERKLLKEPGFLAP